MTKLHDGAGNLGRYMAQKLIKLGQTIRYSVKILISAHFQNNSDYIFNRPDI